MEIVYVLFGTDCVKSYGENDSVLDIDLEHGEGTFDKIDTSVDSVRDILEKCIGWHEYEFISKEEYEILLERQSIIDNKENEN